MKFTFIDLKRPEVRITLLALAVIFAVMLLEWMGAGSAARSWPRDPYYFKSWELLA